MKGSKVVNLTEGVFGFTSNVYLIEGKNPAIIDAGNDRAILKNLRNRTSKLDKILLTHLHPDHVGTSQEIKEEFNAKIYAWEKERDWIDFELSENQKIEAGNSIIEALHTPGHYPNHLVFYGDGALFSGDLIFPGGSFGRTDIPGGNLKELIKSMEKVLERFGGQIKEMYPGHMQPILENAEKHIRTSISMAKKQ